MPDPTDLIFEQFARITGALAAPSRLKLVDRLCQGEQSVEQLASSSGLSVPNASRQLRMLADCGLLAVRRDPPYVYYRVANESVLEFWFALRTLARTQLAELDRIVKELLSGKDATEPISRDELMERMKTGEVVLLDVRPEAEYRSGHIPGALSVPLDALESRLVALPRECEVVAYCRGPYCMLSADAIRILGDRGFRAARLEDGFPEWRAAGLPVRAGE